MAATKTMMTYAYTTSDKLKDIPIEQGRMLFLHDTGTIALDFKGTRTFYNQILVLDTEEERQNLESPQNGRFYFVEDTCVLWRYGGYAWKQITSEPKERISFNTDLPEIGEENNLYVNKINKNISIWIDEIQGYEIVGEKVLSMSKEDVAGLF